MTVSQAMPDELVCTENLKRVYFDYVRDGGVAGRDGQIPKTLEGDIDSIVDDISSKLVDGRYQFVSFMQMLKVKGSDGPPRVISVPTARDRIVLKSVAQYLSSIGVRPEKPQSTIEQIKSAIEGQWSDAAFIKIDIKNFYPGIDHALLEGALINTVKSKSVIELILKACRTPTLPKRAPNVKSVQSVGIPQGLSISNPVAEIFMSEFDQLVSDQPGVKYFRFVDDILIFCPQGRVSGMVSLVQRNLKGRYRLTPHPFNAPGSKSVKGLIARDEFQYIGYVFRRARARRLVSVRDSSRHRHEASLVKFFTEYKHRLRNIPKNCNVIDWEESCLEKLEWWVNIVVAGCIFERVHHGWIRYYSQVDDYAMLNALDDLVMKLCKEYQVVGRVKLRTHRKVHRAMNHYGHKRKNYILDFDGMSTGKKRPILIKYLGCNNEWVSRLSDEEVEEVFRKKMRRQISLLEKDLGLLS